VDAADRQGASMAVLGVSYSENPKNSGAFTSNNDYYSSSSSLFEVSAVEAEYYAFDTTDITPETLAALQAGDLQVSLNFTLQSSAVFSSYVDVYAFNDIETQPVIEAGGSELDTSPYDDITDPPAPDDLGGFEVKEQDGSVEVSVDVTSALAAAAATGNDLIVSFRENSGGEITDVSGVSLTGTGYQNVGLEVESEGGSTSLRTTDGKAVKPLSAYSFTYSLTDQFYASHVSAIGEPVATLEVLVSKAVNGTLSSPGYAITAEGTNASGQGVYLVEGDTDFLGRIQVPERTPPGGS
jgi:hypothetical protein